MHLRFGGLFRERLGGGGGGYYPEFYGISRTSASVSSGFPSMRKLVKAQDRGASA